MAKIIGYYGTAPTKEKFKALKDSFGSYEEICWKDIEEIIKKRLEDLYGDKLEKKDVIFESIPLKENPDHNDHEYHLTFSFILK